MKDDLTLYGSIVRCCIMLVDLLRRGIAVKVD